MITLEETIEKLKLSFSDPEIKKHILDKEYYEDNIKYGIDCYGFCYYANEIIYKLYGGKKFWKAVCIRKLDWPEGGPHIFLINKMNNGILDITSEQYTLRKIEIPYDKGKGFGFRNMSNKSKKLAKMALKIEI